MPLSTADQGLLDAARYGTGKLLAVWLKRGASPAASVPLDATTLANGTAGFGVWHWLVDREHDALLLDLLGRADTPCPLMAQDAWGNTAAHRAAEHRPSLFSPLAHHTAGVLAVRNQNGETPLDVLQRCHPDLFATLPLPAGPVPAPVTMLQVDDAAPLTLAAPQPTVDFPADWTTPPRPDPALPGEANISDQAWQQRLWSPDQLPPAPEDLPAAEPLPFVPPEVEWSTFSLDSLGNPIALPGANPMDDPSLLVEGPHEGETVMPPVAVNEEDAWVVDMGALLRPTSLLHGIKGPVAGRPSLASPPPVGSPPVILPMPSAPSVRPVPSPLPSTPATTPFPELRLLANRADQPALVPLDECPDETVGHAFIANPEAWAGQVMALRTQGKTDLGSLEGFMLNRTLAPTDTPAEAWALNDEKALLTEDGSAPRTVRQGEAVATPAWGLLDMSPGPQDLGAAIAQEMARVAAVMPEAPSWNLLPMVNAPTIGLTPDDGWNDAPKVLVPREPPSWKLVGT